jgi:hypothetical protein
MDGAPWFGSQKHLETIHDTHEAASEVAQRMTRLHGTRFEVQAAEPDAKS